MDGGSTDLNCCAGNKTEGAIALTDCDVHDIDIAGRGQ